ncbi:MAG: peptidoglycan D,D-transpeptidase FtsI family protein [Sphingomonadales bacterium]
MTAPSDIQVRLEGVGKLAIENARNRLIVPAVLFVLCFATLGWRVVSLGISGSDEVTRSAREVPGPTASVERRSIVDRNGVLLAGNLSTKSLYAHPRLLLDADEAADRLADTLPDLDRRQLHARLASGRNFVWIKRKLIPREQWAVNRLGIPAFGFKSEMRRVYPQGSLAAHVLGHVDIDNAGIAGVERYFEDELAHPEGRREPLSLALDVRVQHALRDELSRAMVAHNAAGAGGIVMDVETGEMLALVSLPDFDPNQPAEASDAARFNRVTLGVYEMGSTFKTFTIAQALDSGVAGLGDKYDATEPIHEARWTIHDDHPKARWLSVPEIYIFSSNIGSARMALDIGVEAQQAFLSRVGMFRRSEIELPEVGAPIVPTEWRKINAMTVAYGHGIAVSPVQLVSGIAAMVNGGVLRPATVLKVSDRAQVGGTRVINADTSEAVRAMMRLVVAQGTGRQADAKGYLVGGKTGTAEKNIGGSYSREALLSSFVGVFPSTKARYVVFAMLDAPQGNAETLGFAGGGWVAAPVVRQVVTRIAPMLGVRPHDTEAEPTSAVTLAVAGRMDLP